MRDTIAADAAFRTNYSSIMASAAALGANGRGPGVAVHVAVDFDRNLVAFRHVNAVGADFQVSVAAGPKTFEFELSTGNRITGDFDMPRECGTERACIVAFEALRSLVEGACPAANRPAKEPRIRKAAPGSPEAAFSLR
jgi:hypothetical protein